MIMNTKTQTMEQTAINTVRDLPADTVQKTNSGHPGIPMGLRAWAMCYGLKTSILIRIVLFQHPFGTKGNPQ